MPASPVKPPPAGLAPRPEPPYYAVIFTSLRSEEATGRPELPRSPLGGRTSGTDGLGGADKNSGYDTTAERMVELAAQQPGYLGVESARGADGLGITVSYWQSLEAISAWRKHAEHIEARNTGRSAWYEHYALRIAKVERSYGWAREDGLADPAGNNGKHSNPEAD